MHIHELFGIIAGIIALLSIIPYVLGILKGQTKPSRSAYAIWLVVEAVTASSYIASGARSTIWVSLVWALSALIIFCLSIKHGMGGYSKLDIACLVLAGIAIILWVATKDPVTALYASLIADKLGYVPVFKKAYLFPKTENKTSWGMVAVAGILNMFALNSISPKYSLLPITNLIAEWTVFSLLIINQQRSVHERE